MSGTKSPNSKVLELLKAEEAEVRIETLESLSCLKLSDEVIEAVCFSITDPDKGVKNAAVNFLTQCTDARIPAKIAAFISSKEIETRNLAGEILLRIGTNAVQALIDYISIGDDDDKKFAVDVLGLIGSPDSSPAILELMQTNENENVLLACIEALGNNKAAESLNQLIELFEKNELFQPTIIEALGKIETPEALHFVMSKYKAENEFLKFSIIESLGTIGDEETFFFLLSEVAETGSPLVWPLLKSILLLKIKYNFDIPFDEKMRNSILNTLNEADAEYKKIAAHLISVFDDKEILLACLKIYGEDFEVDEILREKFFLSPLVIFQHIPELLNQKPENLKNLVALVKELFEMYNGTGGSILSEIESRNLSDSFTRCLENPDEEIRMLSIELLFSFDIETALLFSDTILEDNNMWNRLRMLDFLEIVVHPKAEELITRLAEDPEEMVSERANEILSQNYFQKTD
ncbi:MAG: HEAT repeat domain-containing protein [Ignavibacteria bacterium]|nr:HEAT repeat domain-containing protein [Ignavibacteria bacterium]